MSASRFHIRHADLSTILPTAVGPVVGGLAGRALGKQYPAIGAELGTIFGGMGGNIGGQLIKEKLESNSDIPPGAPYAIDPSSEDIPPWALQGAQMLQPHMKTSGAMDWILGEVPGASVVQRGVRSHNGGLGEAGRAFAGLSGGGVAGGLAGLGAGKAIELFTGPINVPLVNLPLHELLAGVGGSVGATKGLRRLSPENQGA